MTRAGVRRAAWVLAKYGTYRSDPQSAAVEVALDALLYGGRYGWRGAETRQRLRRTGAADSVLPLARYMLDHSVALAGPYRVRVRVQGAVVGDQARVEVTVTSTHGGRPVPHLPVTVAFAGRALSRTTGAAGAVTAQTTAPLAGPQPVRVTVLRLPSDRLLVRRPVRAGGIPSRGRGSQGARRAGPVVAILARPVVHVSAPGTGPITEAVPGTCGSRPATRPRAPRR